MFHVASEQIDTINLQNKGAKTFCKRPIFTWLDDTPSQKLFSTRCSFLAEDHFFWDLLKEDKIFEFKTFFWSYTSKKINFLTETIF